MRVFPPRPDAGSDHDLVIIQSQSYDAGRDPEGKGRSLLSCMCSYCRHHFVFHIFPGEPQAGPDHLQHHIREIATECYPVTEDCQPTSSQQPRTECRVRYGCTICSMAITLWITPPRLRPEWIQLIMDENRVREAIRVAKKEDAARYADMTPEKEHHYVTTPLYTLNQYLKNILDDDGTGSRKRISFRNKTFFVQFGQTCEPVFQHLGFEVEYDENTQDHYWVPPRLPRQEGKTPLGSPRAFLEDVKSEVQSVLAEKPPIDGQPVVKPFSARDQLEKALGCDRIPSTTSINSSDLQSLRILGAPVNADDALLEFAYNKQVQADPEHASEYVEALGSLAARRSYELQMFVFRQQELLAKSQSDKVAAASKAGPTERAYAHFGLSKDLQEPPAYFISVYKAYRDQSPAQKPDHRLALLEIGKDRNSEEILKEVYTTEMELAEACQFLGVESTWPMDSIAAMAQSLVSDVDVDLVILALDAVSRSRATDDSNRAAFENVVAELRSSRQLQLLSTGGGQADGTRSVADKSDAADGSRAVVDMSLPVGLANLRNTCYLNSILQYFYSVNAVRSLALSFDLPALEPSEQNWSNLLRNDNDNNAGHSDFETGRAFVGHEFTRELSTLFRELDAAGSAYVSPRQRLANAALLRPEKLRPRSADGDKAPQGQDTDVPPLPPRAAERSNSRGSNTPTVEAELSETASSGSSHTLVGDTPLATIEEYPADKHVPGPVDGPGEQPPPAGRASKGQAKMLKLTVEELAAELDKPNVGSDQMDVDEVMGNAIDHLRAAFKISGAGQSEGTPDPIKEAFFSTFIDNRKKIGESDWNRTTRLDRWVTAYPAQSGTRDLYDALTNSFDLEPLPGDLLSFTTIERPAPHFHICIQRSDGVRKNSNPITIPDVLYLDRFMHTSDSQSPLSHSRKRAWDIKTRLNETTPPPTSAPSGTAKGGPQGSNAPSKSNVQNEEFADHELDDFLVIGSLDAEDQGPLSSSAAGAAIGGGLGTGDAALDPELKELIAEYGIVEPLASPLQTKEESPTADTTTTDTTAASTPLPPSDLDKFWEKFAAEETAERDRLNAERERLFSDRHEVVYRLHAVVCHAGASASAGHYWVWIHDFECGVWRKYNDTTVSVHPADFVFSELNTKGEPYYLAYVRADEVQNLVSIPRRRPRTPPPVPPRPRSAAAVDGDTAMPDASAAAADDNIVVAVEHKEDVEMPPPPYSA
ncbi:hypothetical protein VTK26DRAFT_2069 [Humicola hyalothermophila]